MINAAILLAVNLFTTATLLVDADLTPAPEIVVHALDPRLSYFDVEVDEDFIRQNYAIRLEFRDKSGLPEFLAPIERYLRAFSPLQDRDSQNEEPFMGTSKLVYQALIIIDRIDEGKRKTYVADGCYLIDVESNVRIKMSMEMNSWLDDTVFGSENPLLNRHKNCNK